MSEIRKKLIPVITSFVEISESILKDLGVKKECTEMLMMNSCTFHSSLGKLVLVIGRMGSHKVSTREVVIRVEDMPETYQKLFNNYCAV